MLGLPSWLLIVPVLGALIFVHELGHFVAAKRFGIKVLEFGFGFPPKLFGIRYGETLYTINLIPLGGFVRMLGEEDPEDPRSFARQGVLQRVIVLSAGSFMNLVTPIVIFTILFMLPHDTLTGGSVVITGVAPRSPAMEAGLRAGDTILSVDSERVTLPGGLVEAVKSRSGQTIDLGVRRGSRVTGLAVSPEFTSHDTVQMVPRSRPPSLKVVDEVSDPATEASLAEARRYDSRLRVGDTLTQGAIGVLIGLASPRYGRTTDPIWEAVPHSLETIWSVLTFTWEGISEGISTRSNPGIAGPIGIAQATGEIAELGVSRVFQLTALLSVSLGVINILPIPALDGGRLMFVLIEWVRRGKRISPKREGLVHLVGFALLLGLIAVISYFDIVRLLNGDSLLN